MQMQQRQFSSLQCSPEVRSDRRGRNYELNRYCDGDRLFLLLHLHCIKVISAAVADLPLRGLPLDIVTKVGLINLRMDEDGIENYHTLRLAVPRIKGRPLCHLCQL